MSQALALAHIETQRRLREQVARGVALAWSTLPAYDAENVPDFLAVVAPLVIAGQRQAVALTNAYIARSMERQPLGLDTERLVGAAVRGGSGPEDVYRRPFVALWTALKTGARYQDAVGAAEARAVTAAAMDVQLSMRATATAVFTADPEIVGYRRIPNSGACDLCLIAAQNRYSTGALMPIHPHCGCGVAPITERHDPIGDGDLMDRLAEMRRRGAQEDHTDRRAAVREEKRAKAARREAADLLRQARELEGNRAGAMRRRATALEKRADTSAAKAAESRSSIARRAEARKEPATPTHGELGPVLVPHGQNFTEL
ncbi:MAG: hypothetical protein PGN13_16280 [Patulibacter minatonensis]